jgi:hypothetical protein
MKKIDEKSLIIPPHISVTWKNVVALSYENDLLHVELVGGKSIAVPNLDNETIHQIYEAHAKYLDQGEIPQDQESAQSFIEGAFGFPLKVGAGGMENLQMAMQHNPEGKDMPDLPPEILKKIVAVAKVLGVDDPHQLPKPESGCNCMHCQVSRALLVASGVVEENLDDEVSDEELSFKNWEIQQKSDNLFVVINPLDDKELYNVFLGDPIGCTCGEKNCEHIKAVLKS